MDEVISMKKYRICAIFAMIFVFCTFAACQSQENNTVTKEQILQTLKASGFEDAHIGYRIYIDANEKTYIDYYDYTCIDFVNLKNDSNSAELLNVVMPLFDDNFHNNGDYILRELLNEENSFSEKWRDIDYHGRNYRGHLDKTATYIECIYVLWK